MQKEEIIKQLMYSVCCKGMEEVDRYKKEFL